jgi:hypothetical protein
MNHHTKIYSALQIDIRILRAQLTRNPNLDTHERSLLFRDLVHALMLRGVIRRKRREVPSYAY